MKFIVIFLGSSILELRGLDGDEGEEEEGDDDDMKGDEGALPISIELSSSVLLVAGGTYSSSEDEDKEAEMGEDRRFISRAFGFW